VREDDSSQSANLPIYVSHKGVNILGRDGLAMLNITINPTHLSITAAVQVELNNLQQVLDLHAELFQPGLGTCTTAKAKLTLCNEAVPKYCKPRRLPFAIKPVVGAELDQLEKNGMMEKVTQSDWATPIVVVRKPGGRVRICGDFKVTLNPMLRNDVYPLPVPQELFHRLNGGVQFSKLVFQKIMEQTLSDIPVVACYLDDLIVTGKTEKEHLTNLQKTLQHLRTVDSDSLSLSAHFYRPV